MSSFVQNLFRRVVTLAIAAESQLLRGISRCLFN